MRSPSDAPARGHRRFPFFRLIGAFLVGIVLATALGAGALYAYDQQYQTRILPGVSVGAVDLSGLDAAAARVRLARAYSSFSEGRLLIKLGDETTVITFGELGRKPDLDAMLDQAFYVGRGTTVFERVADEMRLLTEGVVLVPRMTFDPAIVADRITTIARSAEWRPVDAKTIRTKTGFTTAAAKLGQQVDESEAIAQAVAALSTTSIAHEIVVELTPIPILPNITDAEAQDARMRAAAMAQPVTIAAGEETWVIPAASIHKAISFKRTPDARLEAVVNQKVILAALKPLARQIDSDPVEASYYFGKKGVTFGVSPSKDGRAFDPVATTDSVMSVLAHRAYGVLPAGVKVAPALTIVAPQLTTEQAAAAVSLMKKVSSWTTRYIVGESNGFGVNIQIPTSNLDGYVVGPGETFDFWKAIGPVTREAGYRQGGAIIDGRTQPTGALAGGICSCSTTLFNAAARAGYKIVYRTNHYYYIDRYPLGLDATVLIRNGAVTSMKWQNDTKYPVLIRGINGRGTVTFELYTVPLNRTVSFTKPIVKNVRQATTVTEFTSSLAPGVRKQIEFEHDGMDVWVTRTVKDDLTGTTVHNETFASHYGVVNGVILIGKSNAPVESTDPTTDGGTDTAG